MKSKRLMFITFPVIVLIGVYFLGPVPKRPVYSTAMPTAPAGAAELEAFVAQGEAAHKLKPGNEAEIVWNDSTRAKTPYAVVYLHGFSASKMEGDPVHRRFARTFGCNLYLSRLADHGIDTTEALYYFSCRPPVGKRQTRAGYRQAAWQQSDHHEYFYRRYARAQAGR